MSYALITDGAIGLGRSFSNALADIGYNLIITSKVFNDLAKAKKEIEQKYSNKVQIFVSDLSSENSRKNLFEYTKHYNVEVVINNENVNYSLSFEDGLVLEEKELFKLNVEASHCVFKHYYKKFILNDFGRIINVSSLSGFIPTPYNATYAASRAYLTSLSLAVAKEAKTNNVLVQTLAVRDNKKIVKEGLIKDNTYKGNLNKVARKAIESKRSLILPTFKTKLSYFFIKILPRNLMIKLNKRKPVNKKED